MKESSPFSCFPCPPNPSLFDSLRRLTFRHMTLALVASALSALSALPAAAQTFAYSGPLPGSTTVPTSGNFTGGFNGDGVNAGSYVSPTSSATTSLTFATPGGRAYTANHEQASAFLLNNLTFNNVGGVTVAASSGSLSFAGTTPTISGSGYGTITSPYSAITGTLAAPSLSINGPDITLSPTALPSLSGFVAITNGGTAKTNNAAALDPFGTAAIVLNNGNLSLGSAAGNYTNSLVVNGTDILTIAADNTLINSANSTLTGSGTLNIQGNFLTTLGGNLGSISSFSGTIALAPINGTASSGGITMSNSGSRSAIFDLGQGSGFLQRQNGSATQLTFLGTLIGGANTSLTAASGPNATPCSYGIGGVLTTSTFVDTFNGTIQDGVPTGQGAIPFVSITLFVPGSFVLTNGGSAYSGGTQITQGNLVLTNSTGSATGTGTVSDTGAGNAILSGTGISTGMLIVTNGSHLSPGLNTPGSKFGTTGGTLSVGTLGGATLTNAVLDYDLSAKGTATAPVGANDALVTGGTLSLGTLAFNFNELTPGTLDTATVYTVISGAGSVTTQGSFNTATMAANTTFTGGTAYTPVYNATADGLTVQFTAAPEPGQTATMSLIGLGIFGLLLRARRRRKSTRVTAF